MTLLCNIRSAKEVLADQAALQELSELSRELVGDGLLASFEPGFLRETFLLKDSFLVECRFDTQLAGYALIQTSLVDPPQWLLAVANQLQSIPNLGYANFIVARPKFRGSEGVYDLITQTLDSHPVYQIITFLTFARPSNLRAMRAHHKRGWVSTGHKANLTLPGNHEEFELLARGPDVQRCKMTLRAPL